MKRIRNESGFTLVEMMIVLLIISVLLLITIPNIARHTATIDEKGCEAYRTMLSSQIEAYKLEFKAKPELADLQTEGFVKEGDLVCPNGTELTIVAGVISEKP
ncbi:competence type IV pilus major pilin ComGC [Chryseomicrobium sp. FSL W7-1435]|uniref:competence type IV pilus major pilin ComGC n=1 Tax=Chryseomicrobium sp. FSL W7-1435 TaxID=2921704 RepID=UPI00315AB153